MTQTQYNTLVKLANQEPKRLRFALYAAWTMGRSRLTCQKVSDAEKNIKAVFPMNMMAGRPTDKDDCRAACLAARLNPLEVIGALRTAGFPFPDSMSQSGADMDDVCPVCGKEYDIDGDESSDEGGYWRWTCPHCGATGMAGYDKVFDRHYYVKNAAGNSIPGRPE